MFRVGRETGTAYIFPPPGMRTVTSSVFRSGNILGDSLPKAKICGSNFMLFLVPISCQTE